VAGATPVQAQLFSKIKKKKHYAKINKTKTHVSISFFPLLSVSVTAQTHQNPKTTILQTQHHDTTTHRWPPVTSPPPTATHHQSTTL